MKGGIDSPSGHRENNSSKRALFRFGKPEKLVVSDAIICCLAVLLFLVFPPAPSIRPLSPTSGSQAETEPLARVLALAADYCRRLNGASLYYVCREDVRESQITTVERLSSTGLTQMTYPRTRHWVYDYQLWRTSLGLSEVRTLIEEDGEKKNEPGARLETEDFDFETVILGPNGMFGAKNQEAFDFTLEKKSTVEGEEAAVIRAVPRKGVPVHVLYGTAWLRLRDGAALRIDWDKTSMRNVSAIEKEAKAQGQIYDLIFRSEYGFEKNRLRFPSRYSISLERKDPETEKLLFSPVDKKKTVIEIEVVYSDYKFFTVEVEVKN